LSLQLTALSEHNTIVLTMRTQFHQQIRDAYRDTFGHAMFLRPFTPSDIYDFLLRWPFGGSRLDTIARIYNQLTDRPTLRDMCRNPLVLAMYVAEDQLSGDVQTPDSALTSTLRSSMNCSCDADSPRRGLLPHLHGFASSEKRSSATSRTITY
jgi:hypothetical protein